VGHRARACFFQRKVRVICGFAAAGLGFALAVMPSCSSQTSTNSPTADSIEKGRAIFDRHRCIVCHRAGGVGTPLAGIAERMTREEVRTWIADPKKIKPKTAMPKFPLKPEELEAVTDYVMTLK